MSPKPPWDSVEEVVPAPGGHRTGEAQVITAESGQGVESAWVDDVNHWKNRATVAEAELARLKGDLKMAHVAATNACRVLEDVSRGWGYGGQPLAKGKRR